MDPNRRVMNSSNLWVREAEQIAVAEENALRFAEQEQRRLAKKAEEYARPPETPLPVLPTVELASHLHRCLAALRLCGCREKSWRPRSPTATPGWRSAKPPSCARSRSGGWPRRSRRSDLIRF